MASEEEDEDVSHESELESGLELEELLDDGELGEAGGGASRLLVGFD